MGQPVAEQYFTTRLHNEEINFKWEIPEFEEVWKNGAAMELQRIEVITKDRSKWYFSVGEKLNAARSDFAFFYLTESLQKGGAFNWKVELGAVTNPEGNIQMFEMSATKLRASSTQYSHYRVVIASCSNPPLVNGTLILKGKLSIFKPVAQGSTTPILVSEEFEQSSIMKLGNDMSQLLQTKPDEDNGKFADIEIHTDDGTVIPAHRVVLASRNKYFKKLLTSELAEETTGEISVEGINGEAMKTLVHFLYTGCLPENWSSTKVLHDFTKAAHHCQATELLQFLDENVAKVCDGRSAGNLLMLSKELEMKNAERELRRLIINRLNEFGGDPECDELLLMIGQKQNLISS